ncbi:hypothetical protein [Microbulbifer sp. SAOS-129_SWC]|uniref:hypothetical protein n=1 Tax=Microbulbifer sp. SAOS-129_SWC TaxID=3145235 RepID=UPI003216A47D
MPEDYRLAWMIYAAGTVVLLAAGWWFMRKWRWGWLRHTLLLVFAVSLLVPARSTAPDAPLTPVLPLFAYQTLFEDNGAEPEVIANLVFAAGGTFALMTVWGLFALYLGHRREKRRQFDEDPYFSER